ncbi:hypothetical protein EF888_19900 [Silicimonas algicola]|uniref:Poly-gamma-glutamate synthase PgsB/CapB n=1 Tax=Silicimonas algicola TaxID=1826607 RepID=A0A316G2W0_9RHOB|nr:hypothetical protein [Silicimonas algicola]AZQ69195.1 hypothetical protein EF888_19900 [Silicimonas algicola]PWK54992.1 poly-gamma-glutamate synthase PgsB/CapB [Silicimonas algicola]
MGRGALTGEDLLFLGVPDRLRQVEAPLLRELAEGFAAWPEAADDPDLGPAGRLAVYLGQHANALADQIETLHEAFARFSAGHAGALDAAERQGHVLDFARSLGADGRGLRGDRRALRRWFGFDAMVDRYEHRVGVAERALAFALDRLGLVAASVLSELKEPALRQRLWRRLAIEATADRLTAHAGDARVGAAAFRCLARALEGLPTAEREGALGERSLRTVHRAAMEASGDVWTGVEALDLLRAASPDVFEAALTLRLTRPAPGDDLFLRRKAVGMLCAAVEARPGLAPLLDVARRDKSPAVRQVLALDLWRVPVAPLREQLAELACADPAPEVRAAALTSVERLLERVGVEEVAALWVRVLDSETSPLVLRTALFFADKAMDALLRLDPQGAEAWTEALVPAIERLHVSAGSLAVRRWAAQARERMWCLSDPEARALADRVRAGLESLCEGRSRRLSPAKNLIKSDPLLLGRVLSVLSQGDFGHDVAPRWPAPRVMRGDRFRTRLWRLLHEFRNPSTDKRQAFSHVIGRVYTGTLSSPSTIMAELAQTKVPGEPLFIAEEGGWRPYLPLPDHALSIVDTGCLVRIFTAEGITEITPPSGLARRLVARLRLTWNFPAFAAQRNWSEARGQSPAAYVRALEELGFRFRLRPYETGIGPGAHTEVDPAVARFFPVVIPLPLMGGSLWRDLEGYFFSLYQNSLGQLALFIGAALSAFIGRHLALSVAMRRTRNALPLVLGGWGTRGKSGTERLKAGLLNGLGYPLVCKTTGCEAMFLHGRAFGPLREMFLFRPYDKATIWEQMNVARLARQLGAGVFLWECMGLSPAYVRVLQRHWMRDDISTITNTYPDHEDLQGPAGRNIPEVMTEFLPERGTVLTTEEQMRPILAQAARRLGTRLLGVGWLEAGLLPSDALSRFPYEEHPFNIALVLALADELGADRDRALAEMADRVVPDLGVLRAFPPASIGTRRLEFVNGMSANERYGALGNWERMGFDRQDPEAEPGVWISTVVNNRADRVPRSRVFASMLANDLSADMHLLIGSNLEGLQGYIEEAWTERARELTLWPEGEAGTESDPLGVLAAAARWLRVPRQLDQARRVLEAMLRAQGAPLDPDEIDGLADDPHALEARLLQEGIAETSAIVSYQRRVLQDLSDYENLAERIRKGDDRQKLDADFARLSGVWFRRKIVVVRNFHASGEEVVDRIRTETPPGFLNRVMGIQNIKGTGLDFVYRWMAWDACAIACRHALSRDPSASAEGVRALAAFQEFGLLGEETVRATLAALKADPPLPGLAFIDQVGMIEAKHDQQVAALRAGMGGVGRAGRLDRLASLFEGLLDAGDAVRRRRAADRITRDLVAERISHDRAAVELKKLNARQKGGWLAESLHRTLAAARRPLRGA